MNRTAPLLLLFEQSPEAVLHALNLLPKSNADVSFVGQTISASSPGALVFDGLVFSVHLGDATSILPNYKRVFCDVDLTNIACVLELNLGDNIKGGETIAPIIKGLLSLALHIGKHGNAVASYWRPAHIMTGFEYFTESISLYVEMGVFPVLALVAFENITGGGLRSRGLAFLATQEIQFNLGAYSIPELTRRMVRIVHNIATNGPITGELEMAGIDPGETLKLCPSATGQQVQVRVTSKIDV